jgi:hypothetical protein
MQRTRMGGGSQGFVLQEYHGGVWGKGARKWLKSKSSSGRTNNASKGVDENVIQMLSRSSLLTQNVHSAPITQQAEKLSFARAGREWRASQFSWKLTKGKTVKYQSLELTGWYQAVPYLRLRSQVRRHVAMQSYLSKNHDHSGNRKGKKNIAERMT